MAENAELGMRNAESKSDEPGAGSSFRIPHSAIRTREDPWYVRYLLIGGTDPLALTREVPGRIKHAHLKDVDAALAAKVQSGELSYTQAVAAGMYVPLGSGDVDIAGIVKTLEDNGFDGWYVMEQDTILDGEPRGAGPLADVAFLQGAASGVSA